MEPRNFGIITFARPEPPVPMWMATGISSSSARAKYESTEGSLGEIPSYWSPISPITLKPPLVKSFRKSSSGTRWPGAMPF